MRIILSGMVAGKPHQGGATWAVLQYLLGLHRLGHEVCLIEPVGAEPVNVAYFRALASEFELDGSAALLRDGTRETVGPPYETLRKWARCADLLLNISGMLRNEDLVGDIPVRVYLDLDPGFNQLWHAAEGIDMGFDGHTHFATVGLSIGHPGCPVPTCGREWIPTLQPVVLARWPRAWRIARDAFTTVGNWRSYGGPHYAGAVLGQKAHALRELLSLPTRTAERFELALAIHPDERADLAALRRNGWGLVDPAEVAGTPATYRDFVRGSKAELGIAKSGYVTTRCGWFSDRSACYLASGRPVVAQETGFSRFLPTGEGLFSFGTAEEVVACIEDLNGDYHRHARAARSLAEAHFDSDKVLSRLLENIGAPV